MPKLVLLNGPPCAGKTHLLEFIASSFGLPSMSKDTLKESLYDSLGWTDRNWSRKLSQAAMKLLYEYAYSLLSQSHSCLLEANFVAEQAEKEIALLKTTLDFDVWQVFIWAKPEVLHQRFQERASSASRHPGHLDQELQHEFAAGSMPRSQMKPVKTVGPILSLETTFMDAALAADQQIRVREWLLGLGLTSIDNTLRAQENTFARDSSLS